MGTLFSFAALGGLRFKSTNFRHVSIYQYEEQDKVIILSFLLKGGIFN